MPIEPGSPWGQTVSRRDDLIRVKDETELSRFLSRDGQSGSETVVLEHGLFVDLTGGPHTDDTTMRRYSCDVLDYQTEGRRSRVGSTIGSICLTMQTSLLRWGQVYVSNLGELDRGSVSNRSHPNDGRFEVLDGHQGLSLRDVMTFRYRVRRKMSVEHRLIKRGSHTHVEWESRRIWVKVDGGRPFLCKRIAISIRPDAVLIFVPAIPDRQ